jgi:hypothetical protein
LVERLHGMQEVSGSNPLCSTKSRAVSADKIPANQAKLKIEASEQRPPKQVVD